MTEVDCKHKKFGGVFLSVVPMTEVERGLEKLGVSRTSTMPGPPSPARRYPPFPGRLALGPPFRALICAAAAHDYGNVCQDGTVSQCNIPLRRIYKLLGFPVYGAIIGNQEKGIRKMEIPVTSYRGFDIGKSGFGFYVIGRHEWLGYYPTIAALIGAIDFAI